MSAGTDVTTGLQDAVRDAWSELLGVRRVAADDDFFALGGDSVLLVRLAHRLRADLGLDIAPHALLARPTLDGMVAVAARADTAGPDGAAAQPPAVVSRRRPPTGPWQGERVRRAWDGDGLGTALWTVGVRIRGELDAGLLAEALTWTIRRHTALLTFFPGVLAPLTAELALPREVECPLTVVDATDSLAAAARAHADLCAPFELASPPLIRAMLVRDGAAHLLGLAVDDTVCDAASIPALLADLATVHRRLAAGDDPDGLSGPVSDFTALAAAERERAGDRPWVGPQPRLKIPPPSGAAGPGRWRTTRAPRSLSVEELVTDLLMAIHQVSGEVLPSLLVEHPRRDLAGPAGVGPYAALTPVWAPCPSGDREDVARLAASALRAALGQGRPPGPPGPPCLVVRIAPPVPPIVLGAATTEVAWLTRHELGPSADVRVLYRPDPGELSCEYDTARHDPETVGALMAAAIAERSAG
ncbi:phosphopantetheine-binding protein [Paractinoplanes atraurantiacus]|uniref:Condensation domain-containing protein n=1 Tax=Paractinoplanes atraurantiacus TaxID=1036182 RepID=A0A285GLS2_9ACTN|nr:phosphopantetheine-binding protein [Actinoplanes atraurantiacus]SNY24517.1 Condensation domain-containing protein [Actinoplanes atraurantiacus]